MNWNNFDEHCQASLFENDVEDDYMSRQEPTLYPSYDHDFQTGQQCGGNTRKPNFINYSAAPGALQHAPATRSNSMNVAETKNETPVTNKLDHMSNQGSSRTNFLTQKKKKS